MNPTLRLLLMLTTVALTVACHPGGNEVDPEAAAATRAEALAPREVRLTMPEVREEHPTIELVGEVRAFDTIAVSSDVAGQVDRVLVEVGDHVAGGAPLAEVDRATYRIYLDRAEAELAAARANLVLAAKDLERKRDLLSDNTIPQASFDQAEATHDLAQAQVAAAEAAQRLAQRNWERSAVRAPAAGWITERRVVAGQYADVAQTLFDLAAGTTVKVVARVPAVWAARLAGLEGFDFTVGLSSATRHARLYSVDPVVQEASRSFDVVGVADNHDRQIRPGQFANITLVAPNPVRSLWLPVSAVLAADLPQVLLAQDGAVAMRHVQTGRRAEDSVEILQGLDSDEHVIAEVAGLSRGLPVKIVGTADDL